MPAEILIQTVVSGLLMGFIFSLIAVGLTLIFGVMDIVNFAHGDYLMLSMYTAFWLYTLWGVDPLLSLPICVVLLFIVGWLTYKLIINKILQAPMLAQIFSTFGLMIFLRNAALLAWSPDYRAIGESFVSGRIKLFGIFIPTPQLVASVGAILTTALIYWFIQRTETGLALQATAEDAEAASLMGINSERMYALSWGLGAACVGVAGGLLATWYYIFPEVGYMFGLLAYVTVALGGFGSITGAFIAGIIIGLVEVLFGFLIAPAFKYVFVYIIYLAVVIIRPQGLLGTR
jgi:branched-chain amino acid transport system permease protein